MTARNTENSYGWAARSLHWIVALGVFAMFALGLWMRSLDYYHPWYQPAPDLHISFGFCLIALMLVRVIWKAINPNPSPIGSNPTEQQLARAAHVALYVVLIALMTTGYLYATAEGRPTDIFGVISVPAIPGATAVKGTIGWVHEYLAYTIIALATVHALAALKHHFVDRDDTLRRIIIENPSQKN